jgi:hypothetical protein
MRPDFGESRHASHFLTPFNQRHFMQKEVLAVKRKYWLLLLVCAVLLNISPAMADDGFYVVAVGGVGTKITSLPKTITAPGFYYLGGNLTCSEGNGITVSVSDVTIDLMGFRLSGNSSSDGIFGTENNVEVRNGTLSGWNHAININGVGNRMINLRARENTHGIYLLGSDHLVKGCSAQDNTNTGILAYGSTISNNLVSTSSSGTYGIQGYGIISGNRVSGGYTYGIYCNDSSNVIGNIIFSTGTGITLLNAASVVDQNTVSGSSTPYAGDSALTVWAGKSTDNPWGSNAGHQ